MVTNIYMLAIYALSESLQKSNEVDSGSSIFEGMN